VQDQLFNRILDKVKTWVSQQRIARMANAVARRAKPASDVRPVIFFNASARLGHLSQNAAFALLAAWGLRLADLPVLHFVCNAGMTRCVLGTNPDEPSRPPPCAACVTQSQRLYAKAKVHWFDYSEDAALRKQIADRSLHQLQSIDFGGLPLGELVLPGLRWALRRNDLVDDEGTRLLMREYILSAHNVAREFEAYLESVKPQAVIVFNGIMFPEATARQVAQQRGVRVITHEVGLLPLSAFFTDGQATAYPLQIPDDFQLNDEQNRRLDEYLSQRFRGNFSMAGINFWRSMQAPDEAFLQKAKQFKHIVPIFTNVVFDTSQVHANTLFTDMFAWLNEMLELIKSHSETLFVIRAHPDEMRPGTRKQSRQNVAQWVNDNGVGKLANVIFVNSDEYLSSYALIERAHFVMVYNSSIGLEASIMGKPVLCAGAARYTQYQTVFFPSSAKDYIDLAHQFLSGDKVDQSEEFAREARRVLYFQLFRTSLPFDRYLELHSRMGYVQLGSFSTAALLPENSASIAAIADGIRNGQPFLV
jgi:hypothetical protein